jgi:hypothetical protein
VGCAYGAERAGRGDDVFGYDASAPLDVRESWREKSDGLTVRTITYKSPKGGRVPALVVEPAGKGPFAGLIVQHGMPGTAERMRDVAEAYARLGAVVVAIDAPFARRAGAPVLFTPRDRRDQIQLIVDLRRAVDLLQQRKDVRDDDIAYFGVSYGGAMGGLLAGVEKRVAAFVLAVGDGGLVEHFTGPESGGQLEFLSPAQRKRWLAAMRPIEPLRYVRRATAPLLFQSGRADDLVPPADARRYHAAAPEPKQVIWYDGGHFLPPKAGCDAARWLARHIGTSRNYAGCAG